MVSPRTLLLLLGLWAAGAAAQTFTAPCGTLAKNGLKNINGCTECMASDKSCQLCHHTRAPVWSSTGKITECKAATEGAASVRASGDKNCQRADGQWCIVCKAGFYMNARFVCVNTGTALAKCQATSGNTQCAECNIDGTCKRCLKPGDRLLPTSALYINAPAHQSRCLAAVTVTREARDLMSIPTWALITNCVEYTSDFRCARCAGTGLWNPTADGTKCVLSSSATGNRCPATGLRFRDYCSRCTNGKCTTCGWGRMPINGDCRLNCKQLFGIGCQQCSVPAAGVLVLNIPATQAFPVPLPGTAPFPGTCTKVDDLFKAGRR